MGLKSYKDLKIIGCFEEYKPVKRFYRTSLKLQRSGIFIELNNERGHYTGLNDKRLIDDIKEYERLILFDGQEEIFNVSMEAIVKYKPLSDNQKAILLKYVTS